MLENILQPGHVHTDIAGTSKKKVLQTIAQIISESCPEEELTEDLIFDSLINREKLGSTGFGNGVAIPHARVAQTDHIITAFFRLEEAVSFDAIDKKPVDLLFVLLAPENEESAHLEVLASLAEKFGNADIRSGLRSQDSQGIYRLLTS